MSAVKRDAAGLIDRLDQADGYDRVVVRRFVEGVRKVRNLYHMVDWGLGAEYIVHNNDLGTVIRGLLERVFFHWEIVDGVKTMMRPFRPTGEFVFEGLRNFRTELLSRTWTILPASREEFLAPLGGPKLARYTLAADSVEQSACTRKDAKLKTFVKAEKINVSEKPDPDPRVIQPREARYCYELGLFMRPLEKMIFRCINKLFGEKTVMKGLNADKRGAAILKTWSKYRRPVAIGLDASRFDQHVSSAMLQWEHSVYCGIFHDPRLAELLSWQIRNVGTVYAEEGRVNYSVEGSRMSGDMNTSLGNVLIMCALVWTYLQTKNFGCSLINDGDDCILICERENFEEFADLQEWFGHYGFVMKVEAPVFELEGIEFCQCHPIMISAGYCRMVRNPWQCLSKDAAVVRSVRSESDHEFYRAAIAKCGLALAGDVPVFCSFYSVIGGNANLTKAQRKRMETKAPETGMEFLALGMHAKQEHPTDICRVSFAKAFDIWPDMQLLLEQRFTELSPAWATPELVSHTVGLVPLS